MLLPIFAALMSIPVFRKASQQADTSDEDLMLAYASGQAKAFEVLYQRHRRPVFNFILRSVHAPDLAEELMQEVFMRVIQNAENYTRSARFTTWLYTIARNICIDSYRRKKHRYTLSLQQPSPALGEDAPPLEQTIEDPDSKDRNENYTIHRKIHGLLEAALQTLPDEQREVFLLREVSQLPFKEIASIVGTLENTVKSRMRYALEHLRKHLEDAGISADEIL